MAYITISEASKRYSKSEKTIRRLYQTKPLKRSQGYTNKKNQWRLNTDWLDTIWGDKTELPTGEDIPVKRSKSSQLDTDTLDLLKDTLQTLTQQLKAKDEQIKNLDTKLGQQQALSLSLQTQMDKLNDRLAITAPQTGKKEPKGTKTQPATKKPVKQPVKASAGNNNTTKKRKRWWETKLF